MDKNYITAFMAHLQSMGIEYATYRFNGCMDNYFADFDSRTITVTDVHVRFCYETEMEYMDGLLDFLYMEYMNGEDTPDCPPMF